MIEANRNCLCCGIQFRGVSNFCSDPCRTRYERARWGENGTHINRFVVVNRSKPPVQRKNGVDRKEQS